MAQNQRKKKNHTGGSSGNGGRSSPSSAQQTGAKGTEMEPPKGLPARFQGKTRSSADYPRGAPMATGGMPLLALAPC